MAKSLELKLNKNFLLTIQQAQWIRQESKQKNISESELLRNLLEKEMTQ